MSLKAKLILTLIVLTFSTCLLAESPHEGIVERMPNLVLQLGILIMAARLGAGLVEKLGVPGVLGELLIGVLIGPYLLGGIPIPGFEYGLFSTGHPGFPIQPELYGIAIIASIILLFLSGLETDLNLLIRFSLAGTVVGIGGIVFSFAFGALVAMYFLKLPFMDPKCLFLGIMSTATSVGITARILSEKKKMDTPEGVTILAGAVIDDVLGVILLAIVLGISIAMKTGTGALNWSKIGLIAFKEIGIWLGVTVLGLYFAHKLGGLLKRFKNRFVFSIIAFSIALVTAGLFERAGLAMIIGAYVVGLTFSKTDISVSIQEALHPLQVFFVPVFFTVMGMLVDVKALLAPGTLIFGVVYTVAAIAAKFVGCGVPALALDFNWTGAKRIGYGMIPRGEIALIIASIGLSYGFLNDPNYNIFGIAVFMTLITTVVSPPLLNRELRNNRKGVKDNVQMPKPEILEYDLQDKAIADILVHKISQQFTSMGFFVNRLETGDQGYHMRRHNASASLEQHQNIIQIQTEKETAIFVKRMVHEAIIEIKRTVLGILDLEIGDHHSDDPKVRNFSLGSVFFADRIVPELHSETKEGAVWRLLEKLHDTGDIKEVKPLYWEIVETWKTLSAGLINQVAIPHLHTDKVDKVTLACGVTQKGISFDAVDKQDSRLIFLILTPMNEANKHIHLLSLISRLCRQPTKVGQIITESDPETIHSLIIEAVTLPPVPPANPTS